MPGESETTNSRGWFKDPDSDPSRTARRDESGLFGWTVLILIFIGIAIACWIGSFYVFGHPEKPISHQILTKLKKLEPPKRFELTAAPRGEFLRAEELIDRYGPLKPRQLARTNETLVRNYLRNYKPAEGLVPYVIGTFEILDSFELGGSDFFPGGVVAVARSKENPNLLVEHVFCAPERTVPTLHRTLLTGLEIDLKRENELAAVVNVERLKDGRLKLTTVSIMYPSYESAGTDGTFTLSPPERLNVGAGLPVVKAERQREADAKFEHHQKKHRTASRKPAPATVDDARLVRVEKPLPVEPAAQASTPAPPALTTPAPSPSPLFAEVRKAEAVVPGAAAVEAVEPVTETAFAPTATPLPSPLAAVSPGPVPTVSPSPSPSPEARKAIAAAGGRNWSVYEPGRMPRGRLVGAGEIAELAKRRTAGERLYLQGNFRVTAAGADRAVLRMPQRMLGGRTDNIRVIVQYPEGVQAPPDGANVSRDSQRPFQIMDVREGTGGQINVYVREVTKP